MLVYKSQGYDGNGHPYEPMSTYYLIDPRHYFKNWGGTSLPSDTLPFDSDQFLAMCGVRVFGANEIRLSNLPYVEIVSTVETLPDDARFLKHINLSGRDVF